MENKEQQILTEISAIMASVRNQMELLDAKMAEYQQTVGAVAEDIVPIDLDIDVEAAQLDPVVPVETETLMPDAEPDDDLPSDDLPFEDLHLEDFPVEDNAVEDLPEAAEEETSVFEPVPEPHQMPVAEQVEKKPAVIDTMTARHPWRTDMPGTAVKDIRSAISLNDRIIFINYLFNEDPMIFQDALNKINQMTSFEEAVDYVVSEHPEWDLGSEVVYRFMMAVRRRLR